MSLLDWKSYSGDIKATSDIILTNNDIEIISNPVEVMISIVKERLQTNKGDLPYYPTYGSDLESLKGKGIDASLLNTIKFKITNSLTYDNYIQKKDLRIVCISDKNVVNIYIGIDYNGEEILVKAKYFDDGSMYVE